MNYGELKTAIIGRSHRADLTARIPEFIELAETEYNQRADAAYSITGGADTVHNWLSDNAPLVYVWGGLKHLAAYTNDDAALSKYTALFEQAVREAQYVEVRDSGIFNEPAEFDAAILPPATFNILTG